MLSGEFLRDAHACDAWQLLHWFKTQGGCGSTVRIAYWLEEGGDIAIATSTGFGTMTMQEYGAA
jgi:hypothetical protein